MDLGDLESVLRDASAGKSIEGEVVIAAVNAAIYYEIPKDLGWGPRLRYCEGDVTLSGEHGWSSCQLS